MTTAVPACPRCGAHMRPAAQWCTLCYADLRPAPPSPVVPETPEPELVSVPETAQDAAGGGEGAVVEGAVAAGRGKHAKRVAPSVRPGAEPGTRATNEEELGVDAMLALLAAESHRPIPGLGGLARKLDSGGARTAMMAGGIVAFSAVLFVLMAIIGSML